MRPDSVEIHSAEGASDLANHCVKSDHVLKVLLVQDSLMLQSHSLLQMPSMTDRHLNQSAESSPDLAYSKCTVNDLQSLSILVCLPLIPLFRYDKLCMECEVKDRDCQSRESAMETKLSEIQVENSGLLERIQFLEDELQVISSSYLSSG